MNTKPLCQTSQLIKMASLAKWLSVHLRTTSLWVRIALLSLTSTTPRSVFKIEKYIAKLSKRFNIYYNYCYLSLKTKDEVSINTQRHLQKGRAQGVELLLNAHNF